MKKIKLFFAFALALSSFGANAQDFSDPQWASWGETADERKANLMTNSFLKEAIDNKDYASAVESLQTLLKNAPKGSDAIYARGVVLYRNKINRARSLSEKNMYIDSVLLLHDLRLENFGDHATRGASYILDSKARLFATLKPTDREGLREVFKAAIEAGGAETKPDLVCIYFQNLCDDYKMDEVMADEVLAEYERLSPFFAGLSEADAEYVEKFEGTFGVSGAASCENLEALFAKKIEADPENADLLNQAVALMTRANCSGDFYLATAEKLYSLRPTSASAMSLAAAFQNQGDYDKASKYLNDALAAEEDIEEREKLYGRIAIVEMAANRMDKALAAAREAIKTEDGTLEDNGIALFVRAQCYGASASACSDFACQAIYWAAYDAMAQAVANFSESEQNYKAPAQSMMSSYARSFPTQEECFFNEVQAGSSYTVSRGTAAGVSTTVRYR